MAENDGGTFLGGVVAVFFLVALVRSCDDSPGYSSGGYSSARSDDSDGELREAVNDFEDARQKLAEVAFDESQRTQYVKAVDAELDRMDYDFDGVLPWENQSRTRFRDLLLAACHAKGVAPPQHLSRLGEPFDKSQASIDWGGSDASKLPDNVRRWIAEQAATADPLRHEVARLNAKQLVASKILALASLREELQKKLREAQTLVHTFESDIGKIQENVREERSKRKIATASAAMRVQLLRNDLEILRSKRAYVRYLRTFIGALEGATTELQFVETRSRDEFAMTKLVGGQESQRLVEKIDLTLTKYGGTAFDRKLEVDTDETTEDIWQELHRMTTTDTTATTT